jgi:hypothetical protein
VCKTVVFEEQRLEPVEQAAGKVEEPAHVVVRKHCFLGARTVAEVTVRRYW